MKDRSDDPPHHEANTLTTELRLAPGSDCVTVVSSLTGGETPTVSTLVAGTNNGSNVRLNVFHETIQRSAIIPTALNVTIHSTLSKRHPSHSVNEHSFICAGAGRSSDVERSLMVRWVVGSILHRVDPLSYFSMTGVTRCFS